uniref:Retrovirus-related Pol polyprotein from transposon TNT 1-94 n=1 Tax=Cajanus cajan TaxID=3821 RepID=A0A151SZ81_CAJCA|nr:Retrovirus-related Pol polyprotein from transposon TNT 1-94 [Cajanus cajan]
MSKSEPTLYIKTQGQYDTLIVYLYVDDLIYTGNNMKMMIEFKENMMKTFEMKDLSLMNYFLGIKVSQKKKGILIFQKKYIEALLKKFKMSGCKTITTLLVTKEKLQKDDGPPDADASCYRSVIGSLRYLTATRPGIMYAVSLLSRFMQSPSQIHFGAAKRILRYLQGKKEFGIWYKTMTNSSLLGYTDSDWGLCLGIFSWASKKQATVAQSTAEVEYVAAAETISQAIWLRRILAKMGE